MGVSLADLRILEYPDAGGLLRKKAQPVAAVTAEVRDVAARMIDLMHEAEGIGLAAPQVGVLWRMFVVEIDADAEAGRSAGADPASATRGPVVYINPTFTAVEGGLETHEEGCLSLPDLRGDVLRPARITIHATGLDGKPFTQRGEGLLARCWQHEMDHLDGVLILDRFTQQSRLKLRRQLRELEGRR